MNERKSLLQSRPDPWLSAIAFPCSESNSGSPFAGRSLAGFLLTGLALAFCRLSANRLPATSFSRPAPSSLLATGYRPPATGTRYCLPATRHKLPAPSSLLATGYRPPATGYRLPASRFRPFATGYRLPATGYRLLASRWLFAPSSQLPATDWNNPAQGSPLSGANRVNLHQNPVPRVPFPC